MKILFWLAVVAEGIACLGYLYQAWGYRIKKMAGDYAPRYEKALIPAIVLALLCLGALIARFYFHSPRVANVIAFLPAIMLVIALLGMILATMFYGGKGQ